MRTRSTGSAVVLTVVLLVVGLASGVLAEEDSIAVVVSPNVLNLLSYGGSVSLHTDISYNSVQAVSLTVDDVSVAWSEIFADNRGQLVVKCDIGDIKALVEPEQAKFDLTVVTTDGTERTGWDTITVISQSGVSRS